MAFQPSKLVRLYATFGRLFIRFADTEVYLSGCLRYNLSKKIGKQGSTEPEAFAAAVYGSLRFKASRDTAKRIIQEEGALDEGQSAAVTAAFEQLAHIATLRDKLAHQHSMLHPTDQSRVVISDAYSTRKLSAFQVWTVYDTDIENAADDLLAARDWFAQDGPLGPLFKNVPATPPTWSYKPSALRLLRRETAEALLEQIYQPQSSEG